MRYFFIALISLYQRFLSPLKGYGCAYRIRHQSNSCSGAVKSLLAQHGVIKSIPLIRLRFRACRHAYDDLKAGYIPPYSADLPCDFPCGDGAFDCASSAGAGCDYCDVLDVIAEWKRLSARTKRRIIAVVLLVLLGLSYWFYGRAVSTVYLTDLGQEQLSFIDRLSQRDAPKVRVLLVVNGKKFYTDIVQLDSTETAYRLELEKSLYDTDIDRLEVLDARVNFANQLVLVDQVIEVFENPEKKGVGQRFKYHFKRRWHF